MLAVGSGSWSDGDIDIVMFRAQTTIGGCETFKWVLPAFLDRSVANPEQGWMTNSDILASKLDYARFDDWPADQRSATLAMLVGWLDEQSQLFPDDLTANDADDHAVLRTWLKARAS